MDLGIEAKEGPQPTVSSEEGPKTIYPNFSIPDKLVNDFLEEHPVEIEDEMTATVRLKVSSIRMDEYGSGVGFSVLAIDDIKPVSGESDEEDDKQSNPAVRRMVRDQMGEE